MKKTAKICVAVLSLSALTSMSAFAATPGAYLGLGLGYGKQNTPSSKKIATPQIKQTNTQGGIAGRVFAGYNINKYFGVEGSLVKLSNATYQSRGHNVPFDGSNYNSNASLTYKMAALDLVGKAYLPIQDSGVNLYALGGAAIVRATTEASLHIKNVTANQVIANGSSSKTQTTVRPVLGAGVSYDIPNTQLTTGVEYSHTFGKGNVKTSTSAIPSTDLVTVNLAYNFG
jgi:hypothetical protein